MSDEFDRNDDAILKGRLALALASARAETCRNKACARKRQCLARMGKDFNCFKPMGDCPNMTETEWRMVGFGMACVRLRLSAYLRAMDDEEFSREAALAPHERRRAQAARRKEAERTRERRRFPYATLLWLDAAVKEREIATTARGLLAFAAGHACRCAAERRMDSECVRGRCRLWDALKEGAGAAAG